MRYNNGLGLEEIFTRCGSLAILSLCRMLTNVSQLFYDGFIAET